MTALKSSPPGKRSTPAPSAARAPARTTIRAAATAEPAARSAAPDSSSLGARLRLGRERSGATVRGLARAIGVSPSLVSQIERGRVMPSVGTLYAMTNELGLLVDDVFKNGAETAARTAAPVPAAVQRQHTRRAIRLSSGVRWEMLTAEPDDDLEFLYVVYDVGGESCAETSMVRHGGKEYAVMLSGQLGVRLGFREFVLGPGDSISFDAQTPHRLWTVGDEPAVAVWAVLNRHGDRRAQPADGRRSPA